MHSLKTSCAGQIFALAKPHDSLGKKTRNRIPKEERKALVETFINKHQKLHNGSFPSLSLTHKEVGGSFYTIREIVREIIQENRVLGPGDLLLHGKCSDSTTSVLMDPVPPLSLSPHGFHSNFPESDENGETINGSHVGPEDRGSHVLDCGEVNSSQLLVHQSTDIARTQFEASCSQENDTKHDAGLQDKVPICDSLTTKHEDKELQVDNKDKGFEEIPFIELQGTAPVNNDEKVNDAGAEMVNMMNNTLGTIDLPAGTVLETFPLSSVTSTMESSDAQLTELHQVCDSGNATETKVETESSIVNPLYLEESSSSISAVNGTQVVAGLMPNHISVPVEKQDGETIVNAAIGNNYETKEFSNGTLTTEQHMPTSTIEQSRSSKNDKAKVDTMSSHGRNEVGSVEEKATVEKGKLDASDGSSSQKGNIATLNRIKPVSWKEQSGQETNPLLAVLKSFFSAFVKFWSE